MSTQLEQIKTNILNLIEEVTTSPKPNYNIDGQSVSWQSYLDSLFDKLSKIDQQLNSGEPFEERSIGIT
jgi:hypothetical protein